MKLTGESKFLIGILVTTVVIIGIAAVALTQPEKPTPALSREALIPPGTHTSGNATASAFLVEFSDFQCPACSAFAPTVSKLTEQYKDKLLFAYRHFPLPAHEFAIPAARAAEAAAKQGKFWEAETLLFANQKNFSDEFFLTEFIKLAKLDELEFKKDVNSNEVKNVVERDQTAARALNLPGTPSFFLNGVLLKDLLSPDDLVKTVEKALQ